VQKVLSRDMQNDYPSTVKEVAKYYTEIQRCLYNEEYTEEELAQLRESLNRSDRSASTVVMFTPNR